MQEKLFFRAVKDGDVSALRSLVEQGPDLVRATDKDKSTGLHWAAWKGHSEVIDILLDAGADIGAHNENFHWGTTALHAAAHGNQKAAVETLIRRGADVNAVRSTGKGTPLDETKAHNAMAAARILRQAGATESG
jgi:ankyrin repeat protein